MVLISLAWMTSAGTQGSAGYFYMLLTTFGILLQPRRVPLFLAVQAGLIAVLLQLEYLHPQLLIGYDNRLQQFLDIGISIIVCLLFNGLIIYVVYQEYRRERQANETLLAQTLRDKEQLQQAQQENQVLLREVYHRTKNNMLVIIAMLRLRARDFADPAVREVFADTEYRIRAMALVHEQLYQAKHLHQLNFTAYLQEMVTTLLGSMIFDGRVRLELALAPLTLPIDKAVPLGLAVNELVTNALKHAFPGGRAGRIALRLHCQAEIMELQIRDDGIGLPEQGVQPAEVSCGQQIAASLVRDQLGGELISENDGGASHTIRLTLPAA